MKRNKGLKILIRIFGATFILALGYIVYLNFPYSSLGQNAEIAEIPEAYQALAEGCKSKGSFHCCMASVRAMANGKYRLAQGQTFSADSCPEGFMLNMLKCRSSYRWCQPQE